CNIKSKKYKKWMKSNRDEDLEDFKKFASSHNKKTREVKRKFYCDKFEAIKNNTKELWKEINKIGTFNTKKNTNLNTIQNISKEGNLLSNPKDIAEEFNNYFCTI